MHVAGRVADREVERGEVVVVGLDVRPLGDGEAEVGEDDADLVDHLADRVDAAGLQRRRPDRQRHVDGVLGEAAGERLVLEHRAALGDRLVDAVFQPVERRSHHRALLRRHARRGPSGGRRRRPSCRAPPRAPPPAPLRRRRRRCVRGDRAPVSRCRLRLWSSNPPGYAPASTEMRRRDKRRHRSGPDRRVHRGRCAGGKSTDQARAPCAFSTSDLNAAGSLTASSARTLRSTSTPALPRPSINRP